jgi:hypothetical protein
LIRVPIARLDRFHGKGVRGEHDELVLFRSGGADTLGKGVDEQRVRMKRFHGIEAHTGRHRRGSRIDVLLHAQCRELRRHRDAEDALNAGARQLANRVLDERMPVAHPDRDGHVGPEACAQGVCLRTRQIGERRSAADRRVVVAHLRDELVRGDASAANETEILGHLVHR